jgi:beta-N-acetylhexosaminidase
LPRIYRTREELDRYELAVFREFIGRARPPGAPGGLVDSMMVCHGWYPCFEPQPTPATLSRRIVTELLRNEFGFDGLIMTDDLDMGAILTSYSLDDTIRLAVEAGNDIVMLCHRVPEIETVHRILGSLPSDQIERGQQHIAEFKKIFSAPHKFSESAFLQINQEIADLRNAVVSEEEAGRIVPERQISPVERY